MAARINTESTRGSGTLIIACGAIANELMAVIKANQLSSIEVQCLPAHWHNTPERIAPAVEAKIIAAEHTHAHVFVAYGDCGTGGLLDKVLDKYGVQRLPGEHCYSFFAGGSVFDKLAEQELGTFYLTDYLVDNFERLILDGLGITRYPELKAQYFAHYTRVLYLAQDSRPEIMVRRQSAAKLAAKALGLPLEIHETTLQPLTHSLLRLYDAAERSPRSYS